MSVGLVETRGRAGAGVGGGGIAGEKREAKDHDDDDELLVRASAVLKSHPPL